MNKKIFIDIIMVVTFSKNSVTFNKQNLIDILSIVATDDIKKLANSKKPGDYIKVIGDIHISQFIPSKKGIFWFKIKGYENNVEIQYMSSIHIFVCFRIFRFDKKNNMYVPTKKCENPGFIQGTNLPNITKMGAWDLVDITLHA